MESSAAFNVATRGNENNFFGSPHHKHVALATVAGLPQPSRLSRASWKCSFVESVAVERDSGENVAPVAPMSSKPSTPLPIAPMAVGSRFATRGTFMKGRSRVSRTPAVLSY